MATEVILTNGAGNIAKISSRGQLATAPLDFSVPMSLCLTTACVAANFFGPLPNKRLVITDMFIGVNRNSPAQGQAIEIFEASSSTSIVSTKLIFKIDLGRQARAIQNGLNYLMSEGIWLNAKIASTMGVTSITISGYFIDA